MHIVAPRRLPFASAHVEMTQVNSARHGQQQAERKIRHHLIQQARRASHHDSPLRSRRNIDGIVAYAPARNDLQVPRLPAFQHITIKMIHARQYCIRALQQRDQRPRPMRPILWRDDQPTPHCSPLSAPALPHPAVCAVINTCHDIARSVTAPSVTATTKPLTQFD